MIVIDIEEYWGGAIQLAGAAHAVSSDPEPADEAVRLLHEAVREVTGKPVEPPPRQRIGFLP